MFQIFSYLKKAGDLTPHSFIASAHAQANSALAYPLSSNSSPNSRRSKPESNSERRNLERDHASASNYGMPKKYSSQDRFQVYS